MTLSREASIFGPSLASWKGDRGASLKCGHSSLIQLEYMHEFQESDPIEREKAIVFDGKSHEQYGASPN
uniref:AlNc14C404G11404 protein n=1 Tax=Albugo laibachii Nc14 TaxID=890382 RepID=F0WYZ4_9STRA|nr:AlNc14C404G11404 [Albugo laibachii Nc14]|eukprot:CCA26708.1 AlNc14C404G11404 [Albugo laibachii Nc14]